jgi:methionyl-tRNA synthetase
MVNYFSQITQDLGISLWLFVVIAVWSFVWKLLALWKSARKKHVAWFIILALVNTIGILQILYYFILSDIDWSKLKNKKIKKIIKKKSKKK